MQNCWEFDADERPTFTELVTILSSMQDDTLYNLLLSYVSTTVP